MHMLLPTYWAVIHNQQRARHAISFRQERNSEMWDKADKLQTCLLLRQKWIEMFRQCAHNIAFYTVFVKKEIQIIRPRKAPGPQGDNLFCFSNSSKKIWIRVVRKKKDEENKQEELAEERK